MQLLLKYDGARGAMMIADDNFGAIGDVMVIWRVGFFMRLQIESDLNHVLVSRDCFQMAEVYPSGHPRLYQISCK